MVFFTNVFAYERHAKWQMIEIFAYKKNIPKFYCIQIRAVSWIGCVKIAYYRWFTTNSFMFRQFFLAHAATMTPWTFEFE